MDPRDTVIVIGTGRAAAVPDGLVLDLQLEGHGSSVAQALDALTADSRAAHGALPDHDVRTHGLGVHPRHDHQGRQVGHTAYQSLQVRTDDPEQVGALVQRLGEAVGDGLAVHGLRTEVADSTEPARLARERAFADARQRAEEYAAHAGRDLGPVLWVREVTLGGPRPMEDMAEARMAMAAGPVTRPGDHELAAQVEVGWSLRSTSPLRV